MYAQTGLVPAPHASQQNAEVTQLRAKINTVLTRLQKVETTFQKIVPPGLNCPRKKMVMLQNGREGISLTDWMTNNCIRVNLSAQLNKAAWMATNGHRANLQIVDNNTSSTRVALWVEGNLSPCLTVGASIMEEINQNSTKDTDIGKASSAEVSPTTRKAEVYAISKNLGTFYLGHGHMASSLSMQDKDFSATNAASTGEKINMMAVRVAFYNKTLHEVSSGLTGVGSAYTVGRVFDNCDGLGRQDRIRFDAQSIGGFSFQGSYAYTNVATMWDVGVRYGKMWGKTKFGVSVFYEQNNAFSWTTSTFVQKTNARYRQVNASAGVLFTNGISLFAAAAYRKWDIDMAPNAWLGFVKIGYQTKFSCEGITAFALNGGYWRNFFVNTNGLNTVREQTKGISGGATVVQFFDRVNTELYLTVQTYKLKVNDGNLYKPVSVGLLGARVSF